MPELPLVRRFPALSTIPRASFGSFPTPVDRVVLEDGRILHIKRDDRTSPLIGGNKVRGLEWLLAEVTRGDRVMTIGPRGSTHALATATYARQLGANAIVVRWNQEMNAAARRVESRTRAIAETIDARWLPAAYVLASALRVSRRVKWWVPAGGTSALAMLGHVNAALELADQVATGACDLPERVVVPFGTGGTAAGLALGFRIAGLRTHVVAVRVVPRILGRARRLVHLAHAAAGLIERVTRQLLPRVRDGDLSVEHRFYGGAYGRPIAAAADERAVEATGVALDDTYSRKALAAALAQRSRSTLWWLTFDGRLLQD